MKFYSSQIKECKQCKSNFKVWTARVNTGKGKFCSKKCYSLWQKTNTWLKTDKNPSKTLEGKKRISESKKGNKSHFWKGGISPLRKKIYDLKEYKDWREKCFIRDNYTCVHCSKVGGKLEVDHIKSFSLIKFENSIKTLEDAINCKELWDINNGRTLCKSCHNKTDNYGWKSYYKTFGIHPAVKIDLYTKGRFI